MVLLAIMPGNSKNFSVFRYCLPGRLTDVSLTNRLLKLKAREDCTRKDESKDLSYLALSHCWGSSEFLTLTHVNYLSFCQGLDIALISKNISIRDIRLPPTGISIYMDRLPLYHSRLGRRPVETVGNDAGRLSYAELTIAASSAWDSSEGFFVDQHPLFLSPCLLGCVAADGREPGRGFYAMPRISQA